MSTVPSRWTRRQFSQILAGSAAVWALPRAAAAMPLGQPSGYAVAGVLGTDASPGAIHLYRVGTTGWWPLQSIEAVNPAHLVAHPALPVLYAVHAVASWNDLPRGAVSAYRLDTVLGRLTHITTQPLSMAATHPRHAVVVADGTSLFVTAESGGISNVLPIAHDGSLRPVAAIRKHLGLQHGDRVKSAAPAHTVLHPDGTFFTADPGQETISAFEFVDGAIALQNSTRVQAGTGPSQLALSRGGHWLYAMHAGDGSISTHAVERGRISPPRQTYALARGAASMCLHPEGRSLLLSGPCGISALRIDPADGRLSLQSEAGEPNLNTLAFNADGSLVFGAQRTSGRVFSMPFHADSGEIGKAQTVAQADDAASLLFFSRSFSSLEP